MKYQQIKKLERGVVRFLWKNDWFSLHKKVYCTECLLKGIQNNLGLIPNHYNAAHVLSKGSYDKLRLHRDNIVPMCVEHHTQFDGQYNGKTRKDMLYYKKMYQDTKDKLINHYQHITNTILPLPDNNDKKYIHLYDLQCYSDKEITQIMEDSN